jgi:hypothetical protein
MTRTVSALVLLLCCAGLVSPAVAADAAAVDACVAALSPDAKLIFDKAKPSVPPKGEIRELVRDTTRGMVIAGQIGRDGARPAAMAAGNCLKMLQTD